jgi:sphingomyelin phosphodiesterase
VATMQVLHITDVHVDPNYMPGSNARCQEPTCCRNDTLGPVRPGGGAGYWGDYRDCDTPFHAFANLVEQAAQSHPVRSDINRKNNK